MQRRKPLLLLALLLSCGAHAEYPWGAASDRVPAESVDVRTVNDNYQRLHSQVLVRQVLHPTRASLDYAAYHANFMIADPEPESPFEATAPPNTARPFGDLIEKASLTSDLRKTSLTSAEQKKPMAFAPLVEFLQARKVASAEKLPEVAAAVRGETWGFKATPGSPYQSVAEVYVHTPASGPVELWAKIEFQPWFKPFAHSPDQDGDGFPEIYGKVRADRVAPSVIAAIQTDYAGTELSEAEVKKWANQLSSYWYPSFNTDLVPPGKQWPDPQTEAAIKSELGGKIIDNPTIVMRGKPQGKPTYEVFVVNPAASAGAASAGAGSGAAAGAGVLKLAKSRPAPKTQPLVDALTHELSAHAQGGGAGSWDEWTKEVAPFHDAVAKRLKTESPKVKGLVGSNGFLFYRHSLEYVVGGDLEKQKKGKNPLPVIVAFKKKLAEHGVDFLFVPVPTKLEVYPDEFDPSGKGLVGKVVNPFARKFLLDLARSGVEVVDLLPTFLNERVSKPNEREPLYQRQDTHWTDRALTRAAEMIATRVKQYGWYSGVSAHAVPMGVRETSFARFGDLHSRIAESEQSKFQPESLVAHQVLLPSGAPYEDDADSPIVVLGDSFTGVYELTDAEHAGVSAHIARGISYPTDLVMSYGGGPNVRQKLMRRGAAALDDKKLVIWMMTARDLFDYWENWEQL